MIIYDPEQIITKRFIIRWPERIIFDGYQIMRCMNYRIELQNSRYYTGPDPSILITGTEQDIDRAIDLIKLQIQPFFNISI